MASNGSRASMIMSSDEASIDQEVMGHPVEEALAVSRNLWPRLEQ